MNTIRHIGALVLGAAFAAQPLLGQQTRITRLPGGVARPVVPAARRGLTASDHLALALAAERRTERECRNLRNREGYVYG